jgi:hypothetical protein
LWPGDGDAATQIVDVAFSRSDWAKWRSRMPRGANRWQKSSEFSAMVPVGGQPSGYWESLE